ncbi:hypothetical protein L596_029285 [Steinernema carpocapsae]|uniref:Uncharacterized protein n=1 Tax=Steinernema carpocapsae TaxID=34508 RepID=A0A4V5ZXF8_STECR|nr:hypothetical protein L596_029285 [Steinernema carpocapsae]
MNQANVSGQLVLLRIRNRNPDSSVVVSRMLKRVGLGLRLCLMLVNVQALQVRYSLINVAIKGTVARTFKNLDLNQCGKMAMRGDAVAYSLYRSHLLSHWIGSCEIFTKIGGFEVKRDRNAAFYLANVQTNLKENCQGGANGKIMLMTGFKCVSVIVNSILQSDEPCNMKANICEQLTNLKVTCTTNPENCAPSNAIWCPKTEAPANSTTGTTETMTTAETTIEKTTTSTTTLTSCEAKTLSTKCPADLKFDCVFDTCLGILKIEAGFDYNSIDALYKPCTDRGALPVKIQNVEQNERIGIWHITQRSGL